jgi:hypothetical protein
MAEQLEETATEKETGSNYLQAILDLEARLLKTVGAYLGTVVRDNIQTAYATLLKGVENERIISELRTTFLGSIALFFANKRLKKKEKR